METVVYEELEALGNEHLRLIVLLSHCGGDFMIAKVCKKILTSRGQAITGLYGLKVDYIEFEPNSYNGVVLVKDGETYIKSNTGSFLKDFEIVAKQAREQGIEYYVMSMFDDYVQDNKKLDKIQYRNLHNRYLKSIDGSYNSMSKVVKQA